MEEGDGFGFKNASKMGEFGFWNIKLTSSRGGCRYRRVTQLITIPKCTTHPKSTESLLRPCKTPYFVSNLFIYALNFVLFVIRGGKKILNWVYILLHCVARAYVFVWIYRYVLKCSCDKIGYHDLYLIWHVLVSNFFYV